MNWRIIVTSDGAGSMVNWQAGGQQDGCRLVQW